MCAVLASCSLLQGNGPVIRKDKTPSKPAVEAGAPESGVEHPGHTRPDKAGPDKKNVGKIDGEWYILKAGSYEINVEEAPYVYFEEAKGQFYANDGCNVINGDFVLAGDRLTFGNTLSTMKSCPGVLFAPSIAKALGGSGPVKIDLHDKGQETVMTMKNSAGATLMTLTRHNLVPLNGQWYVKQIGEQKVNDDNVNLFLDLVDMTLHGNTGCNFFNGAIVVNPRLTNSISFGQMGTTMRLCPDNDVEMVMMVALEQTTTYRLDGKKLSLLDPSGAVLMVLARK